MASSVHSCVGLLTAGDLVAYDVRTFTRGKSSDNKAYVSSKTGGKTFRVAGNVDATAEVSLYARSGELDIPAALETGKTITVQVPAGASTEKMIIDSSSMEVNIEGGELLGISLSLSAVDDASYPNL